MKTSPFSHQSAATPDRILRPKQVAEMLGVSRTQLWRIENNHKLNFPPKLELSSRCKGWRLSDIEHWLQTQSIHSEPSAPPTQH